MRVISMPPVPYDETAVRPGWPDLPVEVRAAVETRLGSPVTAAVSAGGGFTQGFAAVLRTAVGDRVFVKAASLTDQRHLGDWYAREAAVTAVLPTQVAAPRPRWTLTAADFVVTCQDAIDGRMPALPWRPAELAAALDAWATAAAALCEPPSALNAFQLPRLADLARDTLSMWRAIADGRQAPPATPPYRPEWLADLVALEAALPGYADSRGLMHCDLRLDNILIDRAGRAWICDWAWVCHGPAWFDLVSLLVTAYASGLDADRLFARHPAARTAPPDGLDVALAALAGYWLVQAADQPVTGSPYLRHHQAWSGHTALTWLAGRRGW